MLKGLKGKLLFSREKVAGPTRLELATSGVTGQRSFKINPHVTNMSQIRLNSAERRVLELKGKLDEKANFPLKI